MMHLLRVGLLLIPGFSLGKEIEECCKRKIVGDDIYNFIKQVGEAKSEFGCMNDCVYSIEGKPDSMFCFRSGDQRAVCQDSSDSTDSTGSTDLTDECFIDENTDYPGMDLNPETGRTTDRRDSALACRDLCNQNKDCKYFGWKAQSRECWLKTGISKKVVESGTTSGRACKTDVCLEGWTRKDKKCYKFFDTKTSWEKAQATCQKNGADLVSIEDQAENDFIAGTLLGHIPDDTPYDQVFIGGHQFQESGYDYKHWAWADWRSFWYTNWGKSQSDIGAEDCMSMHLRNDHWNDRGIWNDVSCTRDNWFPFICSRITTTADSLEDVINDEASFLIWPDSSEETFVIFDENTRELKTSAFETETIDNGYFHFRPGLCGEEFTISIESKLHPGKFWTNHHSVIKLSDKVDTDGFKEDSCFKIVKTGCRAGSFALKSTKIPEMFIQRENSKLELMASSDNYEKMCWANPVSQQRKLAYCATSVKSEEDGYAHPECCNHLETLEKFGGCCFEVLKGNGETCVPSPISFSGGLSPFQLYMCQQAFLFSSGWDEAKIEENVRKMPYCCLYGGLNIHDNVESVCHDLGYSSTSARKKRQVGLKCGMRCSTLNHCPTKMMSEKSWHRSDDRCCCHPFRRNIMLQNHHPHLNHLQCVDKQYPFG